VSRFPPYEDISHWIRAILIQDDLSFDDTRKDPFPNTILFTSGGGI
jgi:hypothetical protein